MTIGAKRHRIQLKNPGAAVPDGDGGYTETFDPCTPPTAYAEILVASSANLERLAAGAVVLANVSQLVRFKYQADVTTRSRVLFRSKAYSVAAVHNPEWRNVELVLQCVEVLP